MTTTRTRALMTSALALTLAWPSFAEAEGQGDGVYGRFDHALVLALAAGGGIGVQDGDVAARGLIDARLRIVSAGGPVISFAPGADGVHHLMLGIELRPLFPALFLQDMSTGHEWLDLFVSSLGVELGAAFLLPSGDVGLAWGLAVELPVVYPSRFADGLFLRLSARHVNGDRRLVGVRDENRMEEWIVAAQLVIGIGAGSWPATWEPPRYRAR